MSEGEVNRNGLLLWLLRVRVRRLTLGLGFRVRVCGCIGFVDIIAFFLVAVY